MYQGPDSALALARLFDTTEEAAEKPGKQISHWLKPVRNDKFKVLATAQLKLRPFIPDHCCVEAKTFARLYFKEGLRDEPFPLSVALADCELAVLTFGIQRSLASLMPFTLSHPAAALPFRKLNLVWSAFIVGSMAPDFPYIVGTTQYRAVGHRFPGLLLFTLPASLAALWLFHNVIKRPAVGLFPAGVQQRLRGLTGDFRFGGASRFLAILGSIVLGIATHVVWDAFTHSYTWPWYHIRWLQGWVRVPFLRVIPRYYAMQYASTIVGLLVLGIWGWVWYRQTEVVATATPKSQPRSHFALALAMLVLAGVAGFLRAHALMRLPFTPGNFDHFMLVFGLTALDLAFCQVLLYCVLVSSYQVWIIT